MSRKHSKSRRHRDKRHQDDYYSSENVIVNLHDNPRHRPDPSSPASNCSTHSASHNVSNSPIKPVRALNDAQTQFMSAIRTQTLVFGLGPAGTGKSYCTAAMAAKALMSGDIDRVIFTRPAVETGNSLGFLPGKLEDKFDPYFSAFKSCLINIAGKGVVECALKNGNIQVESIAYMRGKTFNRCFVVLDEAQNCSAEEMKMFMTRIGKESTVVVNGDLSQSDLSGYSGLFDAVKRVAKVSGVYVHEFGYDDIVRSDIVKDIIMCYDDREYQAMSY